jgi:tetratricopeptide (TPR) repeat protein
MKVRIRTATLLVAILMLAGVAVLGVVSVVPARPTQGQLTPPPVPPATHDAPAKELSLEDRADIYMARKNYSDAADYYYRALEQSNFKNATLWNKLGIAYQQQAKFHAAGKAYRNAAHLRKDYAEAWNNTGTIFFMENKFRKSVKYYRQAIELRPEDAAFHLNLGTSYYHLKKFPQAVEEYRTALGLDPNVLTEQSSLGTIIRARGTDTEFYFYMAKAFASIGRAEEAVRYLRRAFEDGFADPKRVEGDPDFQKISQYPAYVELMKNPPVPIKD